MSDIKDAKNETIPKVSIVIITYNQEKYIAEAISSAALQDYDNFEIIISDDGSVDSTAEIIESWQLRYPDIIVPLLNKNNLGVTGNCNRAIKACSGRYITIFGGDDILLPGKIKAQVAWLENDPRRVLCGHQVEIFFTDTAKKSYVDTASLRQGFGPEAFIRFGAVLPSQSLMFRASAIPVHGFDEAILIASDYLFMIELLVAGGAYGYVEGVYLRYRDHDANVSKRYADMSKDIEETYSIVSRRYPKYSKLCNESIVKHVIYFSGVRSLKEGCVSDARKKFCLAIRRRPIFIRAWVRLIQTYFINL